MGKPKPEQIAINKERGDLWALRRLQPSLRLERFLDRLDTSSRSEDMRSPFRDDLPTKIAASDAELYE